MGIFGMLSGWTLVDLDDLSPGDPGIVKSMIEVCRMYVPAVPTAGRISQAVARNCKKALETAKQQLPSPVNVQAPDAVAQRVVDGFSKVQASAAGN